MKWLRRSGSTGSNGPDIQKLAQKRDVPRLIEALNHQDKRVRRHAAEALATLGDPRAVPSLVALFMESEDPYWGYYEARTLADRLIGMGPTGVEALVTAASSASKQKRGIAIHQLHAAGRREEAARLRSPARHESFRQRVTQEALGAAQQAYDQFMWSLTDKQPSADEAAEVLALLYDASPHQDLGGGFLVGEAAAERVRAVGARLNRTGGMQLMLDAHARFAARRPAPGLARNLEMMWDGIGAWGG